MIKNDLIDNIYSKARKILGNGQYMSISLGFRIKYSKGLIVVWKSHKNACMLQKLEISQLIGIYLDLKRREKKPNNLCVDCKFKNKCIYESKLTLSCSEYTNS